MCWTIHRGPDTKNSPDKFLWQASEQSRAFFFPEHSVSLTKYFHPREDDNISTCSSAERCRSRAGRSARQPELSEERGQSSTRYFISNKGMQGVDKKKGLRPDTISDIISALCIPLNNDSISTRTVHLFIPSPRTMNLRKRQHSFFSPPFLLLAQDNFREG